MSNPTCTWCGVEFVDYDATTEILGEIVHVQCVRHAEALEGTWGDEVLLGPTATPYGALS